MTTDSLVLAAALLLYFCCWLSFCVIWTVYLCLCFQMIILLLTIAKYWSVYRHFFPRCILGSFEDRVQEVTLTDRFTHLTSRNHFPKTFDIKNDKIAYLKPGIKQNIKIKNAVYIHC